MKTEMARTVLNQACEIAMIDARKAYKMAHTAAVATRVWGDHPENEVINTAASNLCRALSPYAGPFWLV